MARNGSLQHSGGYCSDVSHYRDAILLGRIVGNGGDATVADTITIVSTVATEKKEKNKNTGMASRWRTVEIQDCGITNACRPSFVAGALTANSKLR